MPSFIFTVSLLNLSRHYLSLCVQMSIWPLLTSPVKTQLLFDNNCDLLLPSVMFLFFWVLVPLTAHKPDKVEVMRNGNWNPLIWLKWKQNLTNYENFLKKCFGVLKSREIIIIFPTKMVWLLSFLMRAQIRNIRGNLR